MMRNNVTRFLDSKQVNYQPLEVPAEKLGASDIALILEVPLDQVYKTIVIIRPKGKPILAVIPGTHEVNLKNLAAFLAEKKISLPSQAEAEQITSLKAGGISPLALVNQGFSIVVDNAIHRYPEIIISGGQRGIMIRISPNDLLRLTAARTGNISHPKPESY